MSKFFENVQTPPIASECVRMHSNGFEWIRMDPNTSESIENLANTLKSLARTWKHFANISVKLFSLRSRFRRTRKLPPAHFYLGSIGSVDGCRTVVGRSSDGRRTVVGRSSGWTFGRRACRQRRRKKNHLIEAALFGRLDQMLQTTV